MVKLELLHFESSHWLSHCQVGLSESKQTTVRRSGRVEPLAVDTERMFEKCHWVSKQTLGYQILAGGRTLAAEEARAWMRRELGYEKTCASGEVHEALMREHDMCRAERDSVS
ncbi:Uncharacterized protein Fot_56454 [Forsythia ovata]|uniref:Uncharacterized protein n=1 Tax=Forsythia ovata TaxID=205694 RepID=A0ABD1P143_9LAMI